jgi:GT2 family glycosyltransferase
MPYHRTELRNDPQTDGLIYVLAPVHNRRPVTEKFIACLLRQTDRAYHLVLIDDGSSDGTADMARASGVPLTVIAGRGHWWWGGSLQQGHDWLRSRPLAGNEIVLTMNDDTRFEPDFLAAGRAALAAAPGALVRAQRYSGDTGEFVDAGVKVDWRGLRFEPTREPSEVECFGTRGLFLRAADFLALGGFHPWLLPHYGSDYEFTLRARKRGFRLVSDPSVRLWSDDAATGDMDPGARSLRDYLGRCFSPRFVHNPVYLTSFILLACPPSLIPLHLFRVWYGFLLQLAAAARGRSSPASR